MLYRPDIDGLRAIAVVPVVLFHFNIAAFSGGFVGVDIFFVISGFLITSILAHDCQNGRFSLLDFHARRVKRIFPVLLLVTASTLAAGYFLLNPGDYETAGESAAYTVAFLSNLFFWLNTGYFDASAETMPLLHTWSLGVEEQFYIVWPLLILGLWKWTRFKGAGFLAILIGVTAASFLACWLVTAHDPEAAFYVSPLRAWQFAIGGMIGFLPAMRRGNHSMSLVGIMLLGAAVFGFNEDTAFPGVNAAVPTLGAALIIAAGPTAFVNRLLAMPPLVGVGLISYSLYLWHWPVIVLYRHYAVGRLSVGEISALAAVMTVLSLASYLALERPARKIARPAGRIVAYGLAGTTAVAIAALAVVHNAGFPSRLPPEMAKIASLDIMWEWDCPQLVRMEVDGKEQTACVFGAPWKTAKHRGVLWGDSHAQHFAPLLDQAAKDENVAIVLRFGCTAIVNNTTVFRRHPSRPNYSAECTALQTELLGWMARHDNLSFLIVANAWTGYVSDLYSDKSKKITLDEGFALLEEGVADFAHRFHKASPAKLVLLGDVPRPDFPVPDCYLRASGNLLRDKCDLDLERFQLADVQARVAKWLDQLKDEGIATSAPVSALCSGRACPLLLNGEVIYRDGNHLRRNLSEDTRKELSDRLGLNEIIRAAASAKNVS